MTSEVEVNSGQRQQLSPDERAEVMSRTAELIAQLEAMSGRLRRLASELDGRSEETTTSIAQRHAA